MISTLTLINLPTGVPLKEDDSRRYMTLSTCQRNLIIGLGEAPFLGIENLPASHEVYQGEEAYRFLLEVMLGMKSQVLGENEIVSQIKEAYQKFIDQKGKNPTLNEILEKLFKDAKEVRTKYLTSIKGISYAALSKGLLKQNEAKGRLLITGSGKLATDLIKLLKNDYTLYLTARNIEKSSYLSETFGVSLIPWQREDLYLEFSNILNTIGSEQILFDQDFFNQWSERHSQSGQTFIDLGSPSVLETSLDHQNGIFRLEDIFKFSQERQEDTLEKLKDAAREVDLIIQKRKVSFSLHHPYGWDELTFV